MPACRRDRCRRRRPQLKGCRWAFPYAVAASMAWHTWSHVSKRRPLRANDRSTFHHGSIRLREAAYVGWKTNSQRGWAKENTKTSVARCTLRLSSTLNLSLRHEVARLIVWHVVGIVNLMRKMVHLCSKERTI